MWFVLQVKTGEEKTVRAALREAGIPAFVPEESRPIRKDGAWTQKEYTLFPSYVFLDVSYNAETYYKVKAVPSVIRFLGDGSGPSPLSFLEAEWIRELSGGGEPLQPSVVEKQQDGTYKVVDGILQRFTPQLESVNARNRKATVDITICGEKKTVQLSVVTAGQEATDTEHDEDGGEDTEPPQ